MARGSDLYATEVSCGNVPYNNLRIIIDRTTPSTFKWESQLKFATEIARALFWELTSCSSSFNVENTFNCDFIRSLIFESIREAPIRNTNDERPDIYQVISELSSI
ncbi:19524_t:CDS:2, partial [Funneliformis geosporum]